MEQTDRILKLINVNRPKYALSAAEIEVAKCIMEYNKVGAYPTVGMIINDLQSIYSNKGTVNYALANLIDAGVVEEVKPDIFNIY